MTSQSTLAREAGTSSIERRPRRRRLSASHILIVLAAVLAFVLNVLALQDQSEQTMVAVADGDMEVGTALTADSVRFVPVDADFDGLASMVEESELPGLSDWILLKAVSDGEVVVAGHLARPGAGSGLRSMSLPVGPEHAAGGSISAGDVVDVITVVDDVAVYAAVDIEVIGVSEEREGAFNPGDYHLIVAVDAEQALRLAEALESGSLEIVRSTGAATIELNEAADDS